jgi:hypothetical protein
MRTGPSMLRRSLCERGHCFVIRQEFKETAAFLWTFVELSSTNPTLPSALTRRLLLCHRCTGEQGDQRRSPERRRGNAVEEKEDNPESIFPG